MRWLGGVALAAMLLVSVSGEAQVPPPMPGPGEERAAALLMQAQTRMANDPADGWMLLEEARALAPRPTPFRGMIECMRGAAMRDMLEMSSQAREAFAECRRLLPDHPMAKFTHALFLLSHDFGNEADLLEGTDLLLDVTEQNKQMASHIPDGLFAGLFRRLGYVGDNRRIARVIESMLQQDFLTSSLQNNDALLLRGIVAALDQANVALAIQLVPMLKEGKSLDLISTSLATKSLWDSAADYRKTGLSYRQADYDRSTRIALEKEPVTGLTARVDALAVMDRAQEVYALTMDVMDAVSLGGKDLTDLESAALGAERELANAGLLDEALKLGTAYLAALGDAQIRDALNFAYNHGFRLIEFGRREEGLAVLEKTRRAWELNTSGTEGKGGELYVIALTSCDTRSAKANAAFARVASQRSINPSAYAVALRCRNDVPALAAHMIERMGGATTLEMLTEVAGLRRIDAGRSKAATLTDRELLKRSDVRAALDRVSMPLEKNVAP